MLRYVLFAIGCWLLSSSTSLQAQRLHALLVADTESNISDSVQADLRNIKAVLEAGLPRGRLRIIEITGYEATPNEITSRLHNLAIEPNDSVILFYSGHGGFDPRRGHYLSLTNGGRLYRSQVVVAITQPNTPRFWGVITDCCASIPPLALAPILRPGNQTTLLSHLFLETTGRIDFTSSRSAQVSLGLATPVGGLFTWSLCKVLAENSSRRMNWDEVFQRTREETSQYAQSLMSDDEAVHYHDGVQQRTQIPYSFRTMYGREVNGLSRDANPSCQWSRNAAG